MIALLVLELAHARPAGPCSAPWVSFTSPAAEERDVPLDTAITLLFQEIPGCDVDTSVDTEYRLTLTPADQVPAEISFHTGSGTLEPLAGAPSADLLSATWDGGERRMTFEVSVFAAPDPDGRSVVGLVDPQDPDTILAAIPATGRAQVLWGGWTAERRPREACVGVQQWDGAGRPVGEVQEVCGEPTRARCSTSPGAASGALLALSVLAIRRRRA